jgi:hypothetical protein
VRYLLYLASYPKISRVYWVDFQARTCVCNINVNFLVDSRFIFEKLVCTFSPYTEEKQSYVIECLSWATESRARLGISSICICNIVGTAAGFKHVNRMHIFQASPALVEIENWDLPTGSY